MTRPPLRLARPGQLPAPTAGPDSHQVLDEAIHDARDQELTWTQIGELLGTTAATAARRYREKP
jgi:hypothetical protein